MAGTNTQERARAQGRVRWELLAGLVRKDLKVKYQGSVARLRLVAGQPAAAAGRLHVRLPGRAARPAIPQFGFYLLSGLLVWNAFAGAVGTATGAVVGNAGLVKKVRFPLSVLPLSAVGFALVHFALQLVVLLVRDDRVRATPYFAGPQLLLAIPAIGVALLFTVALSLPGGRRSTCATATPSTCVEVALHGRLLAQPDRLLGVAGPAALEPHGLFWAYFLNPMAGVVTTMQRALYAQNPPLPERRHRARRRRLRLLPGEAGARRRWSSALLLVLGVWTLPAAVGRLRRGAVGDRRRR